MNGTRAYLDWNATAPLRAKARAAMIVALDVVGNASSVHAEGRRAREIVETAREQVAALVNARPEDVVFTAGATEANNWALRADWRNVVVAGIEHELVLASAKAGDATVTEIACATDGVVRVETMAAHVPHGRERALISLQLANAETGVIQPVAKMAAVAREHGLVSHTDAVQAVGRVPVDVAALGVDLMSISAHKIGGPKGVGALIVRGDVDLPAFIVGGGQERRRRAGTENIAAIAGFGAAAAAALAGLDGMTHLRALRDRLEREVLSITPDVVVIGDASPRLPNTSCMALAGHDAATLLIKLDLAGIAVSAGSACSSGKIGGSHVLAAMGIAPALALAAIRVSLGTTSSERDVDAFLAAWADIHATRRGARPTRVSMPAADERRGNELRVGD